MVIKKSTTPPEIQPTVIRFNYVAVVHPLLRERKGEAPKSSHWVKEVEILDVVYSNFGEVPR